MSDFFLSLPPVIFEAIGIAGFALYVLNYGLLTFTHVTSEPKCYFVLNMIAASCVLIGLTHSFNLASALIQLFWIVTSTTAIVLRQRQSRTGRSRSADSDWTQSQRLMPDAKAKP
jgi:hypothetical protein